LAHEVAHAYRHAHELRISDYEVEERLTDLTTIFLGFGVLTVNASQRFRSGTSGVGGSWYSRSEGGYLSMQSMSYLLAARVVARATRQRRSVDCSRPTSARVSRRLANSSAHAMRCSSASAIACSSDARFPEQGTSQMVSAWFTS